MSVDANKTVVRRLYEAVNEGNLDVLNELAVPDYKERSPFPGQPDGIEGLRARLAVIVAAFRPNYAANRMIAEGDLVAVHWTMTGTHKGEIMRIPPTGRSLTFSGIDIFRLSEGKLAEHWHVIESLEMLQQLGVIPAPGS